MAIWQYKLYALPNEEVDSYFLGQNKIEAEDFDNIEWWKYRGPVKNLQETFPYLIEQKSWCEDIRQFGNLDSDCIELCLDGKYTELSFRFDLRILNTKFLNDTISYAKEENLIFATLDYQLFYPLIEILLERINSSNEIKLLKNFSDSPKKNDKS